MTSGPRDCKVCISWSTDGLSFEVIIFVDFARMSKNQQRERNGRISKRVEKKPKGRSKRDK